MEKSRQEMEKQKMRPDIVPNLIHSTIGEEHTTHNAHNIAGNSSGNKNATGESASGRTSNPFQRSTTEPDPKGADK